MNHHARAVVVVISGPFTAVYRSILVFDYICGFSDRVLLAAGVGWV